MNLVTPQFRVLPKVHTHLITASVGFVSPSGKLELFAAVRNKRGWDIPGGHLIPGEFPSQTFEREFSEETGLMLVSSVLPIALLESVDNPDTGIMVYRSQCQNSELNPTLFPEEIFEAKFFSETELLGKYFGDKKQLSILLNLSKQKLY